MVATRGPAKAHAKVSPTNLFCVRHHQVDGQTDERDIGSYQSLPCHPPLNEAHGISSHRSKLYSRTGAAGETAAAVVSWPTEGEAVSCTTEGVVVIQSAVVEVESVLSQLPCWLVETRVPLYARTLRPKYFHPKKQKRRWRHRNRMRDQARQVSMTT